MLQNNRNTRTWCEISLKLTISIFIVNLECILHLAIVFALLSLNSQMLPGVLLLQPQGQQNSTFFTNHNNVLCSRMFQNKKNIRTNCEISSKLTIGVFIVNFQHISHLVLVFPLLILNNEVLPRILLLQSQGEQNSTFVFHKSQYGVAVKDVLEQQKHQNKRQISSKLIISVFIINFEHILHLAPTFTLLNLNSQMLARILLFQSQAQQISSFIFRKSQQCCRLGCFKRICIAFIPRRQLPYKRSH